jgi:serine protease Do
MQELPLVNMMSIRRVFLSVRVRFRDLILTALLILIFPFCGAYAAVLPKCDEPIADIYEKISPAVVTIIGQSINPYRRDDRVTRSVGSGFIVDGRGLVLTNAHVAFGRQSLRVTLDDGTIVPGRLLGADPIFDIAVMEIPKPDKGSLPTVSTGDSDKVRVGEDVIAIGNPMGLDQTITRGIVSGMNRILPGTSMLFVEPMIQTDTPINPGNSGGPLINRCGEVIGITTAIVEDAQNIGFAIPINLVKGVLPSLIKNGRVIRPWLGFDGTLISAELKKVLNLPLVDGLLVEAVEPGSPAEKAGMRGGDLEVTVGTTSLLLGGDIVTSINGRGLGDPEMLAPTLRALAVGDRVKLTVYREGNIREVEFVLPERPLMPSDLPEGQSFFVAPPRGNGEALGGIDK